MSGGTHPNLPTIESTITYLEMNADPGPQPFDLGEFTLVRDAHPTVDRYLAIYKAVGRDYIWNYRPGQSEDEIARIIGAPYTWIYLLKRGSEVVGMAELDAADPRDVELVHFGLIPSLLNRGIGTDFLRAITRRVWDSGAARMWLSTCGLDHPKAISFYEKAGFVIFKTKLGEFKDYRYTGFYDMTDAPQIPHGVRRHENVLAPEHRSKPKP